MTAPGRHLLIDGYNVIHHWPHLKKELREGGEVARARLVNAVQVIHDVEKIRVTIVFDGKGDDIEIERPSGDLSFSVIYSPKGMSADGVIEQLVGVSEHPENVQVATRDNLERETVEALGASSLSPQDLADWVSRCETRLALELRRRKARADRAWRRRE